MTRTVGGKYTVIIILIVTLVLTGMLAINYILLRSHSIMTAEETAEILIDHADRQIDLVFEGIEAVIESLSMQRSVREVDPVAMKDQFIAEVMARNDYVRAVYLGTSEGMMYEWGAGPGFVDHTPSFPEDYDPRERPWYEEALDAGGYTLTEPYIYASIEAMGITAVKPVYEEDRLIGVLGLDLILDGLENLVDSLRIQKGAKVMLLTADRKVLVDQFAPPEERSLELESFEFEDLLEPSLSGNIAQIDGRQYMFTHTINSSTGWQLLLFVPYIEILSFSQENLRIILFYDVLLMMLLGSAVTYMSRRILTGPLEQIISVMHRHETGDLSARIPSQRTTEYDLIARLFNSLSDMSQATSRKMEEQVQRRTEDVLRLQKENMRLRIIEEKERIYSNLHDSLGARLTGINISNNVAKQALMRQEYALLTQMLERIEKNTGQGIEDLKEILMANDETVLTGEEFESFLLEDIASRLSLKDIEYECRLGEIWNPEAIDSEVLLGLRRILEEMVTNTLKHSEARHVLIDIHGKGDILSCTYSDDGLGFDAKEATKRGFGLQGMFSRAERLGWLLKLSTRAQKGVRYTLRLRLGGQQ